MNPRKRAILLGSVTGLLWSVAPIWFSARTGEIFAIYPPAGALTGALISLALYRPLMKSNHWRTLLLGLFALPLSALFFGIFVGLILTIIGDPSGDGTTLSHDPLAAIYTGIMFAYMTIVISFTSYVGCLFFPLAVLNTLLLRWFVRPRPRLN